jgi:tetratricopeptide (TPR) repeat protein
MKGNATDARPPEVRGGRAVVWGSRTVAGWLLPAIGLIALPLAAAPQGRPTAPDPLRQLLATTPADSLPDALRAFEARNARTSQATEALLVLGQLHYARGAYRQAAECYARASARLEPGRKAEGRYWTGLSWLALSEADRARAALDEVAAEKGPRQAAAMLARAQAWDLTQRPTRAMEAIDELLAIDPGEVGPAALARSAELDEAGGREEQARTARERLLREYPRSIEAAAARRSQFSPASRPAGRIRPGASTAVVIGAFVDPARARALAAAARASGFTEAQVVSRGEGLSAVHRVRLGVYPGVNEARQAGAQAEQALGVTFELARPD